MTVCLTWDPDAPPPVAEPFPTSEHAIIQNPTTAMPFVKWQIDGLDLGFDQSAPLDPSGNTLGPFAVGEVVRVMTEVENSTGKTTSAVRSIEIEAPIG